MDIRFPITLEANAAVFLLVLTRITGLFVVAPLFSGVVAPSRLKVLLACGVALCVAPALFGSGETALRAMGTPLAAAVTLLSEFAIGLVAGALVGMVVAAIQAAGQFMAHDVGMAIAHTIDPLSSHQVSIIGQLKAALAIVLFILLDLHHQLVWLLAESFRLLPPGTVANRALPLLGERLGRVASTEGSFLLSSAIQMAMPVTMVLVVVTVALALLARSVPEVNVFITGFTIRVLVGFAVITLMLPVFGRMYEALFRRAVRTSWGLLESLVSQ